MSLRLGNHVFEMHPSGLLRWPAQKISIVSDLHLEKGSHFARRGYFVPPYDSRETLQRLNQVLTAFSPERLIVLGDTFHDAEGFSRLSAEDTALFLKLTDYKPIWVRGNHDGEYVPPGFEGCDIYEQDGVMFRHEAAPHYAGVEISGHYHPKADVVHKGTRITRRCFVEDGKRVIMPAFGSYAGGLPVTNKAFATLFPDNRRLHLLGSAKIFSIREDQKSA